MTTYPTLVLDLSHNNDIPDPLKAFTAAKQAGILAVIHKATQGAIYRDPKFEDRRAAAKATGLLFGAYHFCDGSPPSGQVANFMAAVGDTSGMVMALDVERNPSGSTATPSTAATIAMSLKGRGVSPLIYIGRYGPDGRGGGLPNEWLMACPLWLPAYTSADEPTLPPGWSNWSLWQYTDKSTFLGDDMPCDASRFNGDADEFVPWWARVAGTPVPGGTVQKTNPFSDKPNPVPVTRADVIESVKLLQTDLRAIGLYGGAIDGVWGPRSADAMTKFQAQK